MQTFETFFDFVSTKFDEVMNGLKANDIVVSFGGASNGAAETAPIKGIPQVATLLGKEDAEMDDMTLLSIIADSPLLMSLRYQVDASVDLRARL